MFIRGTYFLSIRMKTLFSEYIMQLVAQFVGDWTNDLGHEERFWASYEFLSPYSDDHEYLVPRPMSQVSGYSHEDMDMVIKQISMAVSKTRGASLSKAVSRGRKRSDKSKYPYKVCSASLPRPKLKRLVEPGHHYYNVSVQERGPETPVRRHSPSHYHPETRPCHPSSTDHYYTVSRPGSGNY